MPTYDYLCKECGYKFEEFQSITGDHLSDCPRCHAPALTRLIGAGSALVFKGSGFYLTDYKRPNKPEPGPGKTSDGTGAKDAPAKPTASE